MRAAMPAPDAPSRSATARGDRALAERLQKLQRLQHEDSQQQEDAQRQAAQRTSEQLDLDAALTTALDQVHTDGYHSLPASASATPTSSAGSNLQMPFIRSASFSNSSAASRPFVSALQPALAPAHIVRHSNGGPDRLGCHGFGCAARLHARQQCGYCADCCSDQSCPTVSHRKQRRQPPPALVTLPQLSTGQGVTPYGHGLGVPQVQRRVPPHSTPQYSIAAGFPTPQALGLAGSSSPHLQHIPLQTWPMRQGGQAQPQLPSPLGAPLGAWVAGPVQPQPPSIPFPPPLPPDAMSRVMSMLSDFAAHSQRAQGPASSALKRPSDHQPSKHAKI